jgi:hypothetical protein
VIYRIFPILIFVVLVSGPASGAIKDLGVVGKTYPVVEPDVVAELKEEAAKKKRFGDEEFLERMKTYQPEDIHHLPRATKWHSRGQRFDPAYLHHEKSRAYGLNRKPFFIPYSCRENADPLFLFFLPQSNIFPPEPMDIAAMIGHDHYCRRACSNFYGD